MGKCADSVDVNTLRTSKKSRRFTTVLAALATATLTLTGCSAIDSFTGSQSMRWVGRDLLAKEGANVADYKAVPLLPGLTAPQAMTAFGRSHSTTQTSDQVSGHGWSITVHQSDYATSVAYSSTCGSLTRDTTTAIVDGREVLAALGGNPDDWTWFTVTDSSGAERVMAEPDIQGRQTWATGTFAVLVDEQGVCAAKGVLMGFKKAGTSTHLDSPYEVFQKARHTDGLAIAGDYDRYEQTWTLNSGGKVVPLWEYDAKGHSIVAVDLGDGLETALDTKSFLRESVSGRASG